MALGCNGGQPAGVGGDESIQHVVGVGLAVLRAPLLRVYGNDFYIFLHDLISVNLLG